jgi:predicted alpha/beta-hydrolase family hydrolase
MEQGASSVLIETPHGPARVAFQHAAHPRAALLLGHGAGGGTGAPDLRATSRAAVSQDVSVALVEQPYRVAGRRSPAPARQLDAAWLAVHEALTAGALEGLPILLGGRSSGARVACRTATAAGAVAVLCLAFPLRPPRRSGAAPADSRLPELEAVSAPTLVVQGARDPFGIPPATATRMVIEVPGDHSLRTASAEVSDAVAEFLVALPY